VNRAQLLAIEPGASKQADQFLAPLNAAMERFGIDSPARQAAFVAQLLHESRSLTAMEESFNYSPGNLTATFNTATAQRFTPELAGQYGRTAQRPANQTMIANTAYANRMGNGTIESGDGWRYRGRGPGQLTGKDNYTRCGAALGLDLVNHPDLVAQPETGCLAFAWFWAQGNPAGINLNLLADAGKIELLSRAVNGGPNGLAQRVALTQRALQVLA
jgi:putative chitinase